MLNLRQVSLQDIARAGGKGASLGELLAAGIRVPEGFVVTADVYRNFMRDNVPELSGAPDPALAATLREKISRGRFPDAVSREILERYRVLGEQARVAVRSSATAEDLPDSSFAGQQETYLNVRGEEALLRRIRDCYASLWSSRAVRYRSEMASEIKDPAMAVIVQEMVESDKAGVLFTVNPLSRYPGEMLINASYGLGESVVSGRVNADSYTVGKDGKILEIRIGDKATEVVYADSGSGKETAEIKVPPERRGKQALELSEIRALAEIGLRVERHYQRPMDIEWALRDGTFYVLQARPITTLERADEAEKVRKYLDGIRLSKSMRETMAFQFEKMPFPYRALDFDLLNVITEQKTRIFAEAGIRINGELTIDDDGIQTLPAPEKGITAKIIRLPGLIRQLRDLEGCAAACESFLKRYRQEIDGIKQLDFESMDEKAAGEFTRYSFELLRDLSYDRFKYAIFPSVFNSSRFTRLIRKVNPKYSAFDFYKGLNNKTAVVADAVSRMAETLKTEPSLRKALAEGADYQTLREHFPLFRDLADAFMRENGYKSDYNCYCADAKTFLEDPDRLTQILRPLTREDAPAAGTGTDDYASLMRALERRTGRKFPRIRQDVERYRLFHYTREETQYLWECLFYYMRKCLKRANFLLLGNPDYKTGIANLFYRELAAALERGRLNETDLEKIQRRRENYPLSRKVWDACKYLVFDAEGDVLKGVSGSEGLAAGTARVILGPEEFYKMRKGDILVCHLTDPEWTPLFGLAAAVVADTGSALSHAAIVAREFNIPAVLGVGFATERFKDGDRIQVDGGKGEVRRG